MVLPFCAFFLGACGDAGSFPGSSSGELILPRGIPAAELPDPGSPAASLTAEYCSGCHGIPSPRRHTAEDWTVVVRRMIRHMDRMKRHMGGGMGGMMMGGSGRVEVPTTREQQRIVAYLGEHALQPARTADLPESEGRELFVETCERCHALPDPEQHPPEEWAEVVARMQRTAREMEMAEISDADGEAIAAYLREASETGG